MIGNHCLRSNRLYLAGLAKVPQASTGSLVSDLVVGTHQASKERRLVAVGVEAQYLFQLEVGIGLPNLHPLHQLMAIEVSVLDEISQLPPVLVHSSPPKLLSASVVLIGLKVG